MLSGEIHIDRLTEVTTVCQPCSVHSHQALDVHVVSAP